MIGVSGSIYKSFTSDMEQLGVTGTALKGLVKRLHYQSIKHLGRIWKYRTAKLTAKQDPKQAKANKRKRQEIHAKTPSHRKHKRRRKHP